jgi:hypothetical protein
MALNSGCILYVVLKEDILLGCQDRVKVQFVATTKR